jgi:hypothetical protein
LRPFPAQPSDCAELRWGSGTTSGTIRCAGKFGRSQVLSRSVFSEKRPNVGVQDGFHVLLGFPKITSAHKNGQAFTNALPTIIFRPKHAFHRDGGNQRYFYGARPHDLLLFQLVNTAITFLVLRNWSCKPPATYPTALGSLHSKTRACV